MRPSPTLAISARAEALRAQGRDIIGLGAGEPDFDTPEHVKQAAIQAIRDGFTKYTAVDGTPALKRAIVQKLERENGLSYRPEQILVSCGGKHSFFNMTQALLGPGDEAILLAPYWVSYPDMVLLAGATPVVLEPGIKQTFRIAPEQLEQAITPRTKLLVLNSPSNPSGVVYSRDELAALGEVLRRHPKVMIASDDIYEHVRWTGGPFVNIANACPDLCERTVVLNGVSKAYAMTGWRIGYAAGPVALIEAMKTVQSQSTSNATSISQVAAQAALEGSQRCIDEMVAVFKERHDLVIQALGEIPGIACVPSAGAFYVFPDVRGAIARLDGVADDVELAEHLIEEAGVALVPGAAFGAPGHLRLSFATSNQLLERALGRLKRSLA